jgi:hypothetical protein
LWDSGNLGYRSCFLGWQSPLGTTEIYCFITMGQCKTSTLTTWMVLLGCKSTAACPLLLGTGLWDPVGCLPLILMVEAAGSPGLLPSLAQCLFCCLCLSHSRAARGCISMSMWRRIKSPLHPSDVWTPHGSLEVWGMRVEEKRCRHGSRRQDGAVPAGESPKALLRWCQPEVQLGEHTAVWGDGWWVGRQQEEEHCSWVRHSQNALVSTVHAWESIAHPQRFEIQQSCHYWKESVADSLRRYLINQNDSQQHMSKGMRVEGDGIWGVSQTAMTLWWYRTCGCCPLLSLSVGRPVSKFQVHLSWPRDISLWPGFSLPQLYLWVSTCDSASLRNTLGHYHSMIPLHR